MEFVAYTLKAILPAIITVVIAFFLTRIIERRIRNLPREKDFSAANATILKLITRWVIGVIAVLVVATILGVKLTVLWTTISALLAMVAFGLFAGWSIISSFLATIIIMIWRPYKVGDRIEVLPDGIKGEVVEMSMMFSTIKLEDKGEVLIPNSQMLQKMIKQLPSN